MWAELKHHLRNGFDLLLPPTCLLCVGRLEPDNGDASLSDACQSNMTALGDAFCRRCAQPYPTPYATDHLCGQCLQRPPPFSCVHATGRYLGGIAEAIHRLKYRNQLPLAKPLSGRLTRMLSDVPGNRPELIVPVPLHPRRLRQRGYNQALELSRPLASTLGIPIDAQVLQRTRHTPSQQGLSAAERRGNLRNAFQLSCPVENRNILLIDDVMTTGETVRECARVLLAGGAAEVRVAVIARA